MKIARIMTRLNLGGPARQALGADPLLRAAGYEVRLFAGEPEAGEGDLFDAYASNAQLDAVRISSLVRGLSPLRDARALKRLKRELGAFKPDLVHTHASKAGVLGRRAAASLEGASRIARIHTFHGHVLEGYFPDFVSKRMIALEQKLARDCDRVVAVSHATADDLVRLGVTTEEQLVVIPPGVELDELLASRRRTGGPLRAQLGLGADDFLVAIVGRLAEVKRPELGLDILELLTERHPELHIVWIGDGDQFGLLERRIQGSDKLARRAHLVGARPDIVDVMPELDAVLLTSRTEGMPVALIEAAAAGLPVVAMEVGGVGELVAHERTGWLGDSVDALSYGLAQLLADPIEARAMGQRARMRVTKRHTSARLASSLAGVYDQAVLERTGSATPSDSTTP